VSVPTSSAGVCSCWQNRRMKKGLFLPVVSAASCLRISPSRVSGSLGKYRTRGLLNPIVNPRFLPHEMQGNPFPYPVDPFKITREVA